ncbi:siderophore-interacting protein [Flagellimonas abyssi]|uniref:Siderophore-interacting protein n=1 Tax=Flagellimonas abyssi TaxID=2864871 RepID=A0ABS7EPF1_9FLAO|nr:siderophore-interacting protein [Allomuricauda abyssi]MBW8199464.1 siderophore-interacting protein [Allomuricauda abyssi]
MAKPNIPIVQDVFTLKSKEFVTPNYIRAVLTGNVELFKEATLGDNNKIFVPPAGMTKVHMREYNSEKKEWVIPPENVRPFMRTYTHRAIDLEKNELVIDFVNHGLEGPASNWANTAEPGHELGIAMKLTKKELFPPEDWYLLVGDATAIPVLSVILESLPASTKGICLIEVHGKEDEQELKTKANITFKWVHNPNPGEGNALIDAVKKVDLPTHSKFGYVACEFSSVKEIRNYLRKEQDWTKGELYAYSYWKHGCSENESAGSRREEKERDG